MKNCKQLYLISMLLCLFGCKNNKENIPFDSKKLLSFDISAVDNKEYEVKLSDLMESIEIIRMDNSTEEAYTKVFKVIVSDNYFVTCTVNYPVKLFRRKDGKFLGNIGRPGQGPGEYFLIWDMAIDESRQRIYLANNSENYIYSYDFQGNFHKDETINFPEGVAFWCGTIYVDKKEDKVLAFQTPASEYNRGDVHIDAIKNTCWVQDFKGNINQCVSAERFVVKQGNSNTIWTSHIHQNSPIYIYGIDNLDSQRADTVYHYNVSNNEFYPVYTTNIPTKRLNIATSRESPLHYYTLQQVHKPGTNVNPENQIGYKFLQVDKRTKEGRYIRLSNDYLGGIEIDPIEWHYRITDDYVVCYIEPLELKEQLEEALENNKDMSAEVRRRVVKLKDSLCENDNNILIICKFKKQ